MKKWRSQNLNCEAPPFLSITSKMGFNLNLSRRLVGGQVMTEASRRASAVIDHFVNSLCHPSSNILSWDWMGMVQKCFILLEEVLCQTDVTNCNIVPLRIPVISVQEMAVGRQMPTATSSTWPAAVWRPCTTWSSTGPSKEEAPRVGKVPPPLYHGNPTGSCVICLSMEARYETASWLICSLAVLSALPSLQCKCLHLGEETLARNQKDPKIGVNYDSLYFASLES